MSEPKPLKELVVETTGHDEVDRKREMARRLRKLGERHRDSGKSEWRGLGHDIPLCACGRPLPCPDAEILEGRFDV